MQWLESVINSTQGSRGRGQLWGLQEVNLAEDRRLQQVYNGRGG